MGHGFGALMGLGMGMGVVLVGTVVGVFAGALILMLAVRLVERFTPPFGRAVLVMLACMGALFAVNAVLAAAGLAGGMGGFAGGYLTPGRLLMLVVDFLVAAWVVQRLLKLPSGERMTYGRVCLIMLVQYAIGLGLGIVFGLAAAVLFGGMLLGMRA